jgi:hypothetical protein
MGVDGALHDHCLLVFDEFFLSFPALFERFE